MSTMVRVNRANPCPACNKPDWCLVGKSAVLCMRVTSGREHQLKDGSIGWIHPFDGKFDHAVDQKMTPRLNDGVVNFSRMMATWMANTSDWQIGKLAHELGVSAHSLQSLGCVVRDNHTCAFPMFDGGRNLVGIRLRTCTGKKFAVKGSHQGLFIPLWKEDKTVFITEGPTDTAAALTMGLFAVGRPSCGGGVFQMVDFVKRSKVNRAVIVADTDVDRETKKGDIMNPGVSGAKLLSEELPISNCILLLPTKDLRSFVTSGGTRLVLTSMLNQCVWRRK